MLRMPPPAAALGHHGSFVRPRAFQEWQGIPDPRADNKPRHRLTAASCRRKWGRAWQATGPCPWQWSSWSRPYHGIPLLMAVVDETWPVFKGNDQDSSRRW